MERSLAQKEGFNTASRESVAFEKLQKFAGEYGVEQRGIERVPVEERTDSGMSKIGTMWLSANMVISSFAIGAVAIGIFELGFVDSALVIILINFLGVIPVCFFSTFGPKFGLRQMVLSRFFFGFHGVKLIRPLTYSPVAFFNIVACIGWSSVNVIVGAQLFKTINPNMPGWAGILLIALSTFVISLFGYKVVHAYERWSWIPSFIIFMVALGTFAHSGRFDNLLPMNTGPAETSAVLSFAATVYGFATGWCPYAADYTVYQPVTRSRTSAFLWTFAGLFVPLVFTELLGAAIMTATIHDEAYLNAYLESGIGGILGAVLLPPLGRFGEFCLAILALSIIANNCPNIYSVSLSLQVLAKETQRVPRFIWTFLATCVYVAISIPGFDHFAPWLENFMVLTSYWLAIYQGVALPEHFIFRRGFGGYVPEHYDNPKALPPGFAAVVAFGFGILGAAMGMSQTWYTGPIARLCGTSEFGADVGFELGFAFAALSFIMLRTLEKKHFKR
ncbi:purine-cytosine permease [Lasiosphaeria miniovina]|uniref:Purine-cytosine permease n=1 Tax=Lasiosphaeria miniovina TaxID=1954250 RepID=A0AA40BHJ6_9PEZI|nr:purine-cytosine permease [Lasiosphaeria miniovina]KAK0734351.1 purine-cytosine permease [Lasiosphaeria miniovina]